MTAAITQKKDIQFDDNGSTTLTKKEWGNETHATFFERYKEATQVFVLDEEPNILLATETAIGRVYVKDSPGIYHEGQVKTNNTPQAGSRYAFIGPMKTFSNDGTLKAEGTFVELPFAAMEQKTALEGLYKEYDVNGSIVISNMRMGKKNGVSYRQDKDGKIMEVTYFDHGKLDEQKTKLCQMQMNKVDVAAKTENIDSYKKIAQAFKLA